jgi:phosphoadenosine phosphosulfate reductase
MISPLSQDEVDITRSKLESAPAEVVLAWIEERFGADAAIASSFGPEDLALIDLARTHAPSLKVFTLDTGRLPPETYEVMEAVRNRYGIDIETYTPVREHVERLETEQGYFSFKKSIEARKECCGLRKVEPLGRALQGRKAWVTGLRRQQATSRTETPVLELDTAHGGIAKLNPLVGWSVEELWSYVRTRGLPYNRLHDQGYPSIGCAPCTRPVKHHEDERSGRWWWEATDHRECGLHVRKTGGGR